MNAMDPLTFEHKTLAAGQWVELSFAEQMGNIGSEVHRAPKWHIQGNQKRFQGAFERALELFDLTIGSSRQHPTRLKEVLYGRYEFCDYFLGNKLNTDPTKMQRYYDQFALLARGNR